MQPQFFQRSNSPSETDRVAIISSTLNSLVLLVDISESISTTSGIITRLSLCTPPILSGISTLELGKLFYHIAATDGKVQPSEKEMLQALIQSKWKPLEGSTDKYGTDQANLIDFDFDCEEAEGTSENGLQSFEEFYRDNKSSFSPAIVNKILQTGKAIATAYRGKNKNEK